MSNTKEIRDIIYGEEYEKNGEKKTSWRRCGTMFIGENGNISIKLTSFPLSGSMIAFKPKPKEEQKQATQEPQEIEYATDTPF